MLSKTMRPIIAMTSIALLLTGCAATLPGKDSGQLPDFSAQTISGENYSSAELASEGALIWFWTPWCAICAQESADIVALTEANPDLLVIGIAGYGSSDEMVAFTERTNTTGLTHLNDETGSLWNSFQVPIQPSLVAVNSKGELRLNIGPSSAKDLQALADWVN
jgi:peroxiredoxin